MLNAEAVPHPQTVVRWSLKNTHRFRRPKHTAGRGTEVSGRVFARRRDTRLSFVNVEAERVRVDHVRQVFCTDHSLRQPWLLLIGVPLIHVVGGGHHGVTSPRTRFIAAERVRHALLGIGERASLRGTEERLVEHRVAVAGQIVRGPRPEVGRALEN